MTQRDHRISFEHEVPFHDVDAMRVVWHGHYFKYFELARTVLFRSRGLDAADIVALGYRFVVIESKCRHSYPLQYAERMRIDAWFKDVEHRLHVRYEITNLSAQRRTAKGHSMLATLDATGNLLLVTPQAILERL
jgi:acyl-CoA thioester hydrolase